jgi:hypothetical protein
VVWWRRARNERPEEDPDETNVVGSHLFLSSDECSAALSAILISLPIGSKLGNLEQTI